jgi:hypothetical protein
MERFCFVISIIEQLGLILVRMIMNAVWELCNRFNFHYDLDMGIINSTFYTTSYCTHTCTLYHWLMIILVLEHKTSKQSFHTVNVQDVNIFVILPGNFLEDTLEMVRWLVLNKGIWCLASQMLWGDLLQYGLTHYSLQQKSNIGYVETGKWVSFVDSQET